MEEFDAVEKGTLPESYRSEHSHRDQGWPSAETGRRHRVPEGWQVAPR
jgi:hypothetical protein